MALQQKKPRLAALFKAAAQAEGFISQLIFYELLSLRDPCPQPFQEHVRWKEPRSPRPGGYRWRNI